MKLDFVIFWQKNGLVQNSEKQKKMQNLRSWVDNKYRKNALFKND